MIPSRPALVLLIITLPWLSAAADVAPAAKLQLRDGWVLQSSAEVGENGPAFSAPSFQPKGWYKTSVPATVMAALTALRVYPDPTAGMNLRAIPGTTYPIGDNFSNIPMPPGSPFRSSWWYRTRFTLPAELRDRQIQLHFDGINFRANVWLNGKQIADATKMAGAWRVFEFDVTKIVSPSGANALAVQVFPPTPEDLAITFVDWNPAPPDKNMGIWRDVYLTTSGAVTLRFPQVITKLDGQAKAGLTVSVEARNETARPVRGTLNGRIEGIQFSQPVELKRHETRVITFAPREFAQLNLDRPRLWWPLNTGPQNLYELALHFQVNGKLSDRLATSFGIREISSELLPAEASYVNPKTGKSRRVYSVNGRRILIRGAGWSSDILLRSSPDRQEAELKYVRDMNLNAVRLEGEIEDDNFLRLADQYGILVFAGWCCCDHWERWNDWDNEDREVAAQSLRDQIRRLRNHPSLANWMNGSDNPPPPDIETMYIGILKELNWPNPYISSATARPTTVSGDSGVKMTGPYEYVAPSYWLLDKQHGGAHGFNTETSPGPAIPVLESLREMLPEDHLWPIDSWWNYHAGGNVFADIAVFSQALAKRYGPSSRLEDYEMKAQAAAYEGQRAMFEAYARNKYTSTGVIQWMLNNAWPSAIWHLYDYYLRLGGGYFGTKKACEPVHILYSYDDSSIAVVNSTYNGFKDLKASVTVYNLDMSVKYSNVVTFDLPADGVVKPAVLPSIAGLSSTYFLQLALHDNTGKTVSTNFYWLSTSADEYDWNSSTWYYTPGKSYADHTALKDLPRTALRVTATNETDGGDRVARIAVENPGQSLAFLVRLNLSTTVRDSEERTLRKDILPVLWSDNYFSLLPGEKRVIAASYKTLAPGASAPVVNVEGWNVDSATIPIAAK